MLATQIRQKDSVFYFCAYPAEDLLEKVRFISRFYAEGAPSLPGDEVEAGDEVATFISKIKATDAAFQRQLSRGVDEQGTLLELERHERMVEGDAHLLDVDRGMRAREATKRLQ